MRSNRVIEVSMMDIKVKVLFGITHLKEAAVLSASEWIVSVLTLVAAALVEWLFDVPESV